MSSDEVRDQADAIGRRFHQVYEHYWKRDRGQEREVPWDDMPDSYRRRVTGTLEMLVREGSVQPGPGLGFHQPDPEALPSTSA